MEIDEKAVPTTPPPNVPDVTEPAVESSLHQSEAAINKLNSSQDIGKEKNSVLTAVGQVKMVDLMGIPIVALTIDGQERLCLAQISSTLLKHYSYNEIHNRRVALGITCVQCTPVQLEILRRAGAMPVSSRRCGMITKREAERLCKSFLTDNSPPKLPDNFTFDVEHRCAWGSRGKFMPSRYNSSRAKCVQCVHCRMFFSPNKFIFHSHRFSDSSYTQPDAANFNSWRRHLHLVPDVDRPDHIVHAWEDVKAMFNGGTRKRFMAAAFSESREVEPKRKVDSAPTSETTVRKSPSTSSNPKPVQTSNANQKKTQSQQPRSSLSQGASTFHPSLYCNPLYSQQFGLQQESTAAAFGWLYGPHALHPYAALAAAAAATAQSSNTTTPPYWFPYAPYLSNQISGMIPPVSAASTSLTSHRNLALDAGVDGPVANEQKSIDPKLTKETDAVNYTQMSKEKLQEMLVSEIRTRQRLEKGFVHIKETDNKTAK